MDEIDSSFILTKAENENFFSPIAVFDFDAEFDTTGEDLLLAQIQKENLLGVYEKLIIAYLFVFIKEKMDILNLMKMILLQLFQ